MQIKNILLSQAIRFFSDASEPIAERRSPLPIIKGLQDIYGFVEVPTKVAELDFSKGVSFFQGYYKGTVINKLQVYENGVLCEAAADTSVCDEFLSEVIAWATTVHGLPVKENGVKAFTSQLEITSSISLDRTLSKLTQIGSLLSQLLKNYGQPVAPYQLSGIKMHYDTAQASGPRPPEFSFERRAGHPYTDNNYFSSAPLRTNDHRHLLNHLEKALES